MRIDLSHGSGGVQTGNLIQQIFLKHFDNEILNRLEDAAVLDVSGKIAFTTDSFVITPLFFAGGNIGKLAVCGTVNDLLMAGAIPKYLTAGFILEEGVESDTLEQIVRSMKEAATEAGVVIVAGDTKVVEGNGGVYINTSGIGEVIHQGVSISNCQPGDIVLLSGYLGEHHAAILSKRMGIENQIQSDCAPLNSIIRNLTEAGVDIHCMRDVTRGGLATVLNEAASSSACGIDIVEGSLPVSDEVRGFCDILGLDPLNMANEGKMIAIVSSADADIALEAMKKSPYGIKAAMIGTVTEGKDVQMVTRLGGRRKINLLYGEGLPRIC